MLVIFYSSIVSILNVLFLVLFLSAKIQIFSLFSNIFPIISFAVLLLLVFIVLLLLVFTVLLLLVFDVLVLLVFDVAKTHKHFNITHIDPSFFGTISYSFADIIRLQGDFPHRLR